MADAQPAPDAAAVQAAEDTFFAALLSGDRTRLTAVLGQDFVLVDVMAGSEIPREALVDSIASRLLIFDAIDRHPGRVRQYGAAAVVTGETRMRGRYDGQVFAAHSRYTHVYVRGSERWFLVSAQGTQIAPPPPS
jgi:ketosteroid isomerase-like protein